MFLSADFLAVNYGVDDAIARFFVDREPPANNLYWKDKLLYLRFETGYIFIPLAIDILHKIGIAKTPLLSEQFVGLMEDIGHISALEEVGKIDKREAIDRCKELVATNCVNHNFYNKLNGYFDQQQENQLVALAGPFTALHRGDLFLYSLCAITFNEELHKNIVENWFALIGALLVLDDSEDVEIDALNNDENAFLQSKLIKDGGKVLQNLVMNYIMKLGKVNKLMATRLDERCKQMLNTPKIQSFI